MSKYGARLTIEDGLIFDSAREARRYRELLLLQKAREIEDLRRQVRFLLIPAQRIDGKLAERECAYVADFVYRDKRSGKTMVEDAKGVRTQAYIIKRKLMLERYGIQIREV